MVLGVFFPCYLFCAFVCCLLLAMLHVCIYREKHSCYGVFICSCTFSSRTGEVTFYNFTQFYASSCLKIGKKAKQIKTFLLCHRKQLQGSSIFKGKIKARSSKQDVWEMSHKPFFCVLTHTKVTEPWGHRVLVWAWAGTGGTFGGTWSPLVRSCSAAELRIRI